jgi:hypothetical protein
MIRAIDQFYADKSEPLRTYLVTLRELILMQDSSITTAWKYGMPFFCYNGKMFAYIWVHKKTNQPYIGIVEGKKIEHPLLIQEKRARMKIMLFDVNEEVPYKTIEGLLKEVLKLYRS